MAPAGTSWRCHLTPASNVLATHGAWAHEWEDDGAHYTSATGTRYFEWDDAADDDASALADRIVARFPALAEAGAGADRAYAAWYTGMLEATAAGALPCAYSDGGDERALADAGVLAMVGPPPLRALPLPPPGEAEPAVADSPWVPYTHLLTPDWIGRTVVVLDHASNGEVLATVDAELPPARPGYAPRYALALQDGARERTTVTAGASGIIPGGHRRVLRAADHPVDALFAEMAAVVPYPPGTEAVRARLRGTAFFPGGSGLWRPHSTPELPAMPYGMVMVVGQDFDTAKHHAKMLPKGDEVSGRTWSRLLALLEAADFTAPPCFFTNAWMGLRSEGDPTGPYIGGKDRAFTRRCAAFLERQIAVQRPRVIASLGAEVPKMLVKLAPALAAAWGAQPKLQDMDAQNAAVVHGVEFPGAGGVSASVVALVHPSMRHANVKRRRFTNWQGRELADDEAEVALLIEALGALGEDRW